MSEPQTDREGDEQQKSSDKKPLNDPLTRSDVEAPRKPFGGERGES